MNFDKEYKIKFFKKRKMITIGIIKQIQIINKLNNDKIADKNDIKLYVIN